MEERHLQLLRHLCVLYFSRIALVIVLYHSTLLLIYALTVEPEWLCWS